MARRHVSLNELLAAALSCLLPQQQRDELRARRASAQVVRSLFHFDHAILHAHGGADEWWNLTPMLVEPHRQKSRRDTSVVAKSRRLDARWSDFMRRTAAGLKPKREPSRWSSRPFRNKMKTRRAR